jgi:hypothetical protein
MLINLVLFYLCIVICLERRTRSSSLVCAALGFSAAVDVLMLGLYASGAISGLNPGASDGLESPWHRRAAPAIPAVSA